MKGSRRRAREMAVQMLYQHELGGCALDQVFSSFDLGHFLQETDGASDRDQEQDAVSDSAVTREQASVSFGHARRLVEGTIQRRHEVDELIRRQAENWRLERMPAIDRNILRLAVFEMLYGEGVPQIVVVDEAIELAKKFGSEDSSRFVNGLLDGILNSDRTGGTARSTGGAP